MLPDAWHVFKHCLIMRMVFFCRSSDRSTVCDNAQTTTQGAPIVVSECRFSTQSDAPLVLHFQHSLNPVIIRLIMMMLMLMLMMVIIVTKPRSEGADLQFCFRL